MGRRSLLTPGRQVVSLKECDREPSRGLALRPRRLARPRTPPFHGDNTGSNPVGDANQESTRYAPFRQNFVGTKRHNFQLRAASFTGSDLGRNAAGSLLALYVGEVDGHTLEQYRVPGSRLCFVQPFCVR